MLFQNPDITNIHGGNNIDRIYLYIVTVTNYRVQLIHCNNN